MKIAMAGIDYGRAPVAVRERFALTKSGARAALEGLRGEGGCVLLSTCSRTELWLEGGGSPRELLCALCGVPAGEFAGCFTERQGREAAEHLFALACGLKSQVFGEDQILTQVGEALALARECGCAGPVLEHLFRAAVTAAKKVKSTVRLSGADRSMAGRAVAFLQERIPLAGAPCMVIGNGEMGRLSAEALAAQGAAVVMTVRQYRRGEVHIPDGVRAIPYEKRLEALPRMRAVVSATASPHFTLRADEVPEFLHPVVLCDLAVPRDIDPALARREGVTLCDADRICGGQPARAGRAELEAAGAILEKHLREFENWYRFRGLVPAVGEISARAAEDLMGRMEKPLRRLPLEGGERAQFAGCLNESAGKAVARLLYGLRENLEPSLWEACIAGLQKSARGEGKA